MIKKDTTNTTGPAEQDAQADGTLEHWQFPGVTLVAAPPIPDGDPWKNRIVAFGYVPNDKLEESVLFHPMNWRTHPLDQEEALLGSIEQVGIVQTCICSINSGRLLDGHDRVKLAKRAGAGVMITFVDVSEEEEEIVLTEFDTVTGMAGTDPRKLAALLDSLRERKIVFNDRLGAMLADLRDRVAGGGFTPPESTDADYTENPYAENGNQTGQNGDLGDDDEGGERVRLIQLFLLASQYQEIIPLLQGLAKHFATNNVTDTVVALVRWATDELEVKPLDNGAFAGEAETLTAQDQDQEDYDDASQTDAE